MSYVIYRMLKKVERQIGVNLKSQYISVRELRSVGYKLDGIDRNNKNSIEEQHKFHEHQRIMLASLNRQVLQLDNLLSRSAKKQINDTAKQARGKTAQLNPARYESSPNDKNNATNSHNRTVSVSSVISKRSLEENSNERGIAFLEELFAKHQNVPQHQATSPNNEATELASRFSSQLEETVEDETIERRVSYG